jgi:1-deoxyxylulose-5-phosphate synthase
MKYRQLGDSGIYVSEIAFGSWLNVEEGDAKRTAIACVHRALDSGITLLDTANVYGRGAAERVLGEALAGIKRDSYVLATKLFFPMTDRDKGLSRAQVFTQVDDSLKRLRVDHIDLYQCHRYDPNTPLAETLQALTEVVRSGKVRHLGFSEWPAEHVQAALAMPQFAKFVSSQPQYSLLHRDPEKEIFPLCEANGIGQIVWSPLAQGILTGKYLPGAALPPDSRAANSAINGFLNTAWLKPAVLEGVQKLKLLARKAGLTLPQFALAWVLRRHGVSAAIIGASRPDQIADNVVASGAIVPAELFAQAEQVMLQSTKRWFWQR